MNFQNILANYGLGILATTVIIILAVAIENQYSKIRKLKISALINKPLTCVEYTLSDFLINYNNLDRYFKNVPNHYGKDEFLWFFKNASERFMKELSASDFEGLHIWLIAFHKLPLVCQDGLRNYSLFSETRSHAYEIVEKVFNKSKDSEGGLTYLFNSLKTQFIVYDDLYATYYTKIREAEKAFTK